MDVMAGLRSRWHRTGVRARSTIAASAILGVVLVAAGVLVSIALQAMLVNSTRQAVALRAHDIATQVAARGVSAVQAVLVTSSTDQTVIQVVRLHGGVVAATSGAVGEAAMLPTGPGIPGTTTAEGRLPFIDNAHYMLARERVSGTDLAVITAQSLAPVDAAVRDVRLALLVLLPMVLVITGWAIWGAVGNSLRSIDAIRRRVDTIGGGDLHQRIVIPPAQDEVAHLARTMNSMLERLDTSARAQRRFIADASHELRSPLASMRLSLDVEQATGRPHEDADVLGSELDRMTRLVNDLLLLAKVDERALTLQRQDVDLDDIVAAEVRRLRHQTHLDVHADIAPVRIIGDPDRLAQAVRNLTDNAQRHAHGRIDIGLSEASHLVRIIVADDGDGIPVAERDRVFERFVRLDEHRSRGAGGSGLGLAITQEIVHAHGGRVHVEQGALGGAQFVVTLPVDTASSR